MKKLLSVCFCSSLTVAVLAQPQPIKDAMHSIYSNLEKAYNKGNLADIDSYFSSDFQWRMLDGKMLKLADAEKNLKEELSNIQSGKWKIVIVNVIGAGPVANAVVQYSFEGVMLDNAKKPYKARLTSTERQNWIRGAEGWKMTSDAILNLSSKQNGNVITPNVKTTDQPVESPTPTTGGA